MLSSVNVFGCKSYPTWSDDVMHVHSLPLADHMTGQVTAHITNHIRVNSAFVSLLLVAADSQFTSGLPTSPSPPIKSESNGNSKGWSSVEEAKGERTCLRQSN